MKNRLLLTAILSVLCLGACSDPAPTPAAPVQPANAAPTEISADEQGVLTDRQREAYNAANQVSNVLNDADAARRRQLEAEGK